MWWRRSRPVAFVTKRLLQSLSTSPVRSYWHIKCHSELDVFSTWPKSPLCFKRTRQSVESFILLSWEMTCLALCLPNLARCCQAVQYVGVDTGFPVKSCLFRHFRSVFPVADLMWLAVKSVKNAQPKQTLSTARTLELHMAEQNVVYEPSGDVYGMKERVWLSHWPFWALSVRFMQCFCDVSFMDYCDGAVFMQSL